MERFLWMEVLHFFRKINILREVVNTLVVCSDFNITMLPSDIQQDSASAGPSSQRGLQIYLILNN